MKKLVCGVWGMLFVLATVQVKGVQLPVFLPDGSQEEMNSDTREPYTRQVFSNLLSKDSSFMLARVIVAGNEPLKERIRYYDAHEFNLRFFEYEHGTLGKGLGYPIVVPHETRLTKKTFHSHQENRLLAGPVRIDYFKYVALDFPIIQDQPLNFFEYWCSYSPSKGFFNDSTSLKRNLPSEFFVHTFNMDQQFAQKNKDYYDKLRTESKAWILKYLKNNLVKGPQGSEIHAPGFLDRLRAYDRELKAQQKFAPALSLAEMRRAAERANNQDEALEWALKISAAEAAQGFVPHELASLHSSLLSLSQKAKRKVKS